MAQIIPFPAATTPAASSAATSTNAPGGVAAPFVEYLDPEIIRAVKDDRPDLYAQLTSLPEPVVVTLPAALLIAAVWLALAAYCVALAIGAVS